MRESIVVICPTPQASAHAADWHDGQFAHDVHAGFALRASECTCGQGLTKPTHQVGRQDDAEILIQENGVGQIATNLFSINHPCDYS
jgi:hypothetical protein